MKLHLPCVLLTLVSACCASADTVLNTFKPTIYYGSLYYDISDNHLILNGSMTLEKSDFCQIKWACSGVSRFDGSGVLTMNASEDEYHNMLVSGSADVTFDSGITLKNTFINVGSDNYGTNVRLICKFENAFAGFTNISIGHVQSVVDLSSVKVWGRDFTITMGEGTLRTTNGFTLKSSVSMLGPSYTASSKASKVEGGLTFASGGMLYYYSTSISPIEISGGLKVSGAGKVCFYSIYGGAASLDGYEVGDYYYRAPSDGKVLMHTDTYSGNLSSLKLVAPRYKVVETLDSNGNAVKSLSGGAMTTMSDMVLVAEPSASGGYDIVLRNKGTATERPYVFPTSITAKQTIKIPKTQLPEGSSTTISVNSSDAVVYTVATKGMSGIGGTYRIEKRGSGTLTLNPENTYTGGTLLAEGVLRGSGEHSFGTGAITVEGGTLDLASKAVGNAVSINGKATVKGGAKYQGKLTIKGELLQGSVLSLAQDANLSGCVISGTLSGNAGVAVSGNTRINAKQTYKGLTTVNSGAVLTLSDKASLAGSVTIKGGTLKAEAPAGLKLVKNQILTLSSGSVSGTAGMLIGTGATLVWNGGTMSVAPVLNGGTLDLAGTRVLQLQGKNATVALGSKSVQLSGKGTIRSNDALSIKSGVVTVSALDGYTSAITVQGGSTLKLAMGKTATKNAITVQGQSAVVNGSTHSGDITVSGTLAAGTNIKLTAATQRVSLKGSGSMAGSISGSGMVDVNANIDATAAKITAAKLNLVSYTLTNNKGMKLVKGQTLKFGGGKLNLGDTGTLTTVAGSTLNIASNGTLTGNLTLGGGELVFTSGRQLQVSGTLTLSKAMTVSGSGSIIYGTLKTSGSFDIDKMFGGCATLNESKHMLTFKATAAAAVLPDEAPSACSLDESAFAVAEEVYHAPTEEAHATPQTAPETHSVADAIVQADWGIFDANRAFMGAVNMRHQHAALLDKGQGAAWVSAFGTSVRHGNQGMHHGSDGNIEGAALGMEHSVSETGVLGLAVGRSMNRIGATGITHLRQETAHVALYGQKQLRNGLTADATAAWGDTETKLGSSSWQQKSAALSGRLTHAHMVNDSTALRTFGGFSYEATDSCNIGMQTHTGCVQNLRAEVGVGALHAMGKAQLYGEAALTGDLVRHNPTAELGGERTHGANPGRTGVKATFGGIYEFTDSWSGTASYTVEAEARSASHTLNLGVSKSF